MDFNERKINRLFYFWLNISLFLLLLIIVVGGLTRLTNSGLSITDWELLEGILPPLNNAKWQFYFDEYKKIPQYKILYSDMSLEEFKIIFFWEYFHRIIARVIGLFFLIPIIYFYFTGKVKKQYMNICYLIFILIVFQGIIGWYMVKSGLVDDVTVSHYRLSIHLTLAILITSMIFWLLKNTYLNINKSFFSFSIKNTPFQIFIFLVFLQIILGAFVSGLDAGRIYQTWPLMGETYFPNDLLFERTNNYFNFNNHSLVQFYHRNLAYIIIVYRVYLSTYIYLNKIEILYKPLTILIILVIFQATLGILTLVSGLNIFFASAHQITSVLLVLSALNLYYLRVK